MFSEQLKKDIAAKKIERNPGEDAGIIILDNSMIGQIHGSVNLSPLILSKENDHYEIYISSRLSKNPNKNQADYSKEAQAILRVFCASISNSEDELFTAIYESAETDNTHGINKNSYVTIGDCQVKYRVEQGQAVIYQIKVK